MLIAVDLLDPFAWLRCSAQKNRELTGDAGSRRCTSPAA